jgi:hypothetical protein
MFDSVIAPCPKCGEDLEWQSKAGECLLNRYPVTMVPMEIAADVDKEWAYCEACKESFQLRLPFQQPVTVSMEVV